MSKWGKHWYIILWCCIVWIMIGGFSRKGVAKTAFQKERPVGVMATAVRDEIAVSWEPVSGATGYEVYEAKSDDGDDAKLTYTLKKRTTKCEYVAKDMEAGSTFFYSIRAYKTKDGAKTQYTKKSVAVSTMVPEEGISTVKNFLKTAIAPVGSTMYVWGGGWNKADTGAGSDAKRIGLSPTWRRFAATKKSSYNYRNYRYQIHNGLDCSGYVGWAVYNVMNTRKNRRGYVYSASKQAQKLSRLGFGTYKAASKVTDYKAGDIMSSTCSCCGHVYIVIGQCKDGSVVLVHASPAGVQINGTVSSGGKKNSQAVKLARKYMKKYYKGWYKRYRKVDRGSTYLSHYAQMRWKTSGDQPVLSDPDHYRDMTPEEILKDLFQ